MAAAAPLAVAIGPMLAQMMAPKPNAFTGTAAPQHIMDDYMQKLTSEFGRQQGQAAQGVSLPDAVLQQSPTMTGGVLPFPIGDANKGLGSGGVVGLGGFGGNRGEDPGSILNFPGTSGSPIDGGPNRIGPRSVANSDPLPSPTPDLPGSQGGGGNGGGDNQFLAAHAPDVKRVQSASRMQMGANDAGDAQAALRMLGIKLGA